MQDRWVSYIYRYMDGRKCENAGYIKVIRTSRESGDCARVEIGLKLYKPLMCRCRVYLIYNQRELILMDELLVKPEERDVIGLKKSLSWNDFLKNGVTPKDYDGVFFAVDDGDSLMSLWNDREININNLSMSENSPKVGLIPMPEYLKIAEKTKDHGEFMKNENISRETYGVGRKDEDANQVELDVNKSLENVSQESQGLDSKIEQEQSNPVEYMMRNCIKLPMFIDSPFLECVKIVPQDIGKLPIGNWKLGQNSFLTHGYYRYKYIMLGKIKFDNHNKETYIIGVPGVYTNKEKYLANMFGFNLFVPVKRADIKTGNFGYWVWEVLKQ